MKKFFKVFFITLGSIIGGIIALMIIGIIYLNLTSGGAITDADTIQKSEEAMKNMFREPSEEKLATRYRDNLQDALYDSTINDNDDDRYMNNIDEVIKQIENDEYVILFYKAIKDENTLSIICCKFKVKEENGKKMYAAMFMNPNEAERKYVMSITDEKADKRAIEDIKGFSLDLLLFYKKYGFNPETDNFVYGYSYSSKINSLRIDGQSPDEIVQYEIFGKTEYLWYYVDLKTDKAPDEMVIEIEE